jgi:hypothetical protein
MLAVVPLVHSLFSTLLSTVVSWDSFWFMSHILIFQSFSSRRICRVTISAVGETVPNLSGCFAHSLQYWCAGAALLAKALICGKGWCGLWQVCCLRWLRCRVTLNSGHVFCRFACSFLQPVSRLLLLAYDILFGRCFILFDGSEFLQSCREF